MSNASPLRIGLAALAAIAFVAALRGLGSGGPPAPPPAAPGVDEGSPSPPGRPAAPPVLEAAEACPSSGYLCAGLAEAGRVRVQRWTTEPDPLIVHVPLPPLDDAATARTLQRAAAAGVRLWNGQPFPVVVDERGSRDAQFAVRWVPSAGEGLIGRARLAWGAGVGLSVEGIDLVTVDPVRGVSIDPALVRLTAAHEMGHALGMPHSDRATDVMFPSSTTTALSARDYRTLEALYRFPDGAEIVP